MSLPGLSSVWALGSAAPVTWAYQGETDTDVDANSFSFASQPLGTVTSDRRILVAVSGINNFTGTISTVTIAGTGATKLVEATNGNTTVAFFIAAISSGTTGTIAGTCSTSKSRYGIGIWSIYNLSSSTAAGSGSATGSGNTQIKNLVTVPGRPVFAYGADSSAGINTFTSPLTRRFDAVVGAASNHSGADGEALSALLDITQTYGTSASHAAIAVSF